MEKHQITDWLLKKKKHKGICEDNRKDPCMYPYTDDLHSMQRDDWHVMQKFWLSVSTFLRYWSLWLVIYLWQELVSSSRKFGVHTGMHVIPQKQCQIEACSSRDNHAKQIFFSWQTSTHAKELEITQLHSEANASAQSAKGSCSWPHKPAWRLWPGQHGVCGQASS